MKVLNLNEFGEDRFVQILTRLALTSLDANKGWFPILIKNYKSYKEWFFVVDFEDKFVAFSTIQEYESECFRLLTRCYLEPEFRRPILPKADKLQSPGTHMINAQISFLNNSFKSIFVSLEHIRRRNTIVRMANKMEFSTARPWRVAEGMYLTCPNMLTYKCWQNICYSGSKPPLKHISYEEWLSLYDKRDVLNK